MTLNASTLRTLPQRRRKWPRKSCDVAGPISEREISSGFQENFRHNSQNKEAQWANWTTRDDGDWES